LIDLKMHSENMKLKEHIFGTVKPPYKGKGKAIPLQAWTGPEGSSFLRPPYFKTIGT